MTPERFKNEMDRIASFYEDDEELKHIHMDDLMCDVLRTLGYSDDVDRFILEAKWYS